jgi:hypothetical protein
MAKFYLKTRPLEFKSISIPTSVEILHRDCFLCEQFVGFREIQSDAFPGCTLLISIFIPSSVQILGANSFQNCKSLESVTFGISSRLETIGEAAFNGCCSLTSICIPAACESIGCVAFGAERFDYQYCKSLQSVKFESGSRLTSIGRRAFDGCSALECFDIPASVLVLGFGCFWRFN